jgi:hypothetical protein
MRPGGSVIQRLGGCVAQVNAMLQQIFSLIESQACC